MDSNKKLANLVKGIVIMLMHHLLVRAILN